MAFFNPQHYHRYFTATRPPHISRNTTEFPKCGNEIILLTKGGGGGSIGAPSARGRWGSGRNLVCGGTIGTGALGNWGV